METPSPEPHIRRNTRRALMEIPARIGALALTPPQDLQTPGRSPLGIHNRMHNGPTTMGLLVETNLPNSYMTPSPSPDELVIQKRGRLKAPVTWSPDIDSSLVRNPHAYKDRTPVKGQHKSNIVLRSTPRKRLLLNDHFELSPSPKKERVMSPNKKCRVEVSMPTIYGPLDSALRALSTDQLVTLIQSVVCRHPYLEQEIKSVLPQPDLKPMEDRLHDLKRNIFKSLPTSRLTSKTDSPAYNRAATHVMAFKKCVQEQGKLLVLSQQWDTVCEYVLLAWKYVSATPLWDNPPHNAARKQCFKFLAAQCMHALKRVAWNEEQTSSFQSKLEPLLKDCEDLKSCLKQLGSMKKSTSIWS